MKIGKLSYFSIVLFSLSVSSLYGKDFAVISAAKSKGEWRKEVVTHREVVSIDEPRKISEINIFVPRDGKYQLLAYVHHNWRNRDAFPCFCVEAVDYRGNKHRGSHIIENIWYLEEDDSGRWFMISLSQNPYWTLPKGKLRLKFWAVGKKSTWEKEETPFEGKIAINSFFLIPILNDGKDLVLSNLLHPEVCQGDWKVINYESSYATNFISSEKEGGRAVCNIDVHKAGYYKILLAVLSSSGGRLKISFNSKLKNQAVPIFLTAGDRWKMVFTEPVYFDRGIYRMELENESVEKIMVDFLLQCRIGEKRN